jgi:hypothetical protein
MALCCGAPLDCYALDMPCVPLGKPMRCPANLSPSLCGLMSVVSRIACFFFVCGWTLTLNGTHDTLHSPRAALPPQRSWKGWRGWAPLACSSLGISHMNHFQTAPCPVCLSAPCDGSLTHPRAHSHTFSSLCSSPLDLLSTPRGWAKKALTGGRIRLITLTALSEVTASGGTDLEVSPPPHATRTKSPRPPTSPTQV